MPVRPARTAGLLLVLAAGLAGVGLTASHPEWIAGSTTAAGVPRVHVEPSPEQVRAAEERQERLRQEEREKAEENGWLPRDRWPDGDDARVDYDYADDWNDGGDKVMTRTTEFPDGSRIEEHYRNGEKVGQTEHIRGGGDDRDTTADDSGRGDDGRSDSGDDDNAKADDGDTDDGDAGDADDEQD